MQSLNYAVSALRLYNQYINRFRPTQDKSGFFFFFFFCNRHYKEMTFLPYFHTSSVFRVTDNKRMLTLQKTTGDLKTRAQFLSTRHRIRHGKESKGYSSDVFVCALVDQQ